ncbi:Nucleoporin [Trema orientale]|uniref:Nucleoporin n=1 Tax=Trema orientale TaxID=63057 RepID=A0A2P5E5Q4_TREOI|nr:Nucleoporin [Trema orientale]
MLSAKELLSIIESSLLGPSPPSPAQKVDLLDAIHSSLPAFQSLLSHPTPKPSDRDKVQSREVRLLDSSPILLDERDVQIALQLSEYLHLNEIECVRLLQHSNQEWGLMGQEPLEVLRLLEGRWYTDRKDLLTALYTLLKAVALDQGLDADLFCDIQSYLEDLISSGLRQRLISLIKELNREEPADLGGPQCERYILDSRGALVERQAVIYSERLVLGHCLILSFLLVGAGPKDIKDIFSLLKDSAGELSDNDDVLKHKITFSLLFSLVIALVSDAQSEEPVLSCDASFRNEFHETVMAVGMNPSVEHYVDCVRLAWAVHLMLIQDATGASTISNASSNGFACLHSCLEVFVSNNVFLFMLDKFLRSPIYQNDSEDIDHLCIYHLHKLMTCFLSHPLARDKVKESKERAMSILSPYCSARQSFWLFGNDELWEFLNFAGEHHTNFQTPLPFLNTLSTLAYCQEGASKVYELLKGKAFHPVRSTLFGYLSLYDDKIKQSLQTAEAMLPEFPEGDAKALVAYLNVHHKVVENGNPIDREYWLSGIVPLFKLLGYKNVPPYLKVDNCVLMLLPPTGALRNAIEISPDLKETIWSYLEHDDLPMFVGLCAQPRDTEIHARFVNNLKQI